MPTILPSTVNKALLVGINDYPWKPLACATADARAIGCVLAAAPYNFDTELLLDSGADRRGLLAAIDRLIAGSGGIRILYLAGHAGSPPGQGPKFVTHGSGDWTDHVAFDEIAGQFEAALRDIGSTLIILDCCQAGAMQLDTNLRADQLREAVTAKAPLPNVGLMLATSVGSAAREKPDIGHGVFTFHLLEGLKGAAADSEGAISAASLHAYCAKKLEPYAYQQPVFKGQLQGRFILGKFMEFASEKHKQLKLRQDSVDELERVLTETETVMAELSPPFVTRDKYRESAWLATTKAIQPLAEKKTRLEQRYGHELEGDSRWIEMRGDIERVLTAVARPSIGTVTDNGRIVRKIGEGAFGVVYKVEDGTASFAYKVFHGTDIGNRAKEERFRTGYRAMNQLAHPRIVSVHKFLESPLSFFMTYVDGPNIRDWWKDAREPVELLSVILEVCETVEYAHGHGVLHRDVKPENVLLRYDDQIARFLPVLTDFDLAWFSTATRHTVEAFGAPFYAAPEQLAQPGASVTHNETVDVYSLGMLLMFMLTGRDPAAPESTIEDLRRLLSSWPSGSNVELLTLLDAAARRSPRMRLSTVAEFRQRLQQVRGKLMTAADPGAALSNSEFISQIAFGLDRPCTHTEDGAELTSASERTEVQLSFAERVLIVQMRKRDRFAATGTTTAAAKESLMRRLGQTVGGYADKFSGTVKRRTSQGGSFATRLEFVGIRLSAEEAQVTANLIADCLAVFDQF
jgi:serine/threonine protein kinase